MSWADVAIEASDHLRHILAMGTSAHSSWEFPAARYLLGLFEREGIPALILPAIVETFDKSSIRPNLVAHIAGNATEDPLLLLSHLDSVTCPSDEWDPAPVSGECVIRGSGALHGMSLSVAQAMALILLARNDIPLRRTIRYAATSEGVGGYARGLRLLALRHLEHISSDIAIGWGGLSFTTEKGISCSLLSTAEKGTLKIRLRAEGSGGLVGVSGQRLNSPDPVDRLIEALGHLDQISFPPVVSRGSKELVRSVGTLLPKDFPEEILKDLCNIKAVAEALPAFVSSPDIDPGIIELVRSGVSVEKSVTKLHSYTGDGLKPRIAEADIIYTYPPGIDPENITRKVLEKIADYGVYMSDKSVQAPSGSQISSDIEMVVRVSLREVDSKAHLLTGITPFASGLGALRHFGTKVYGWEPFIGSGDLSEMLKTKGGGYEEIEIADFINSVRTLYSFLCRTST